jgi:hypothetical protein
MDEAKPPRKRVDSPIQKRNLIYRREDETFAIY